MPTDQLKMRQRPVQARSSDRVEKILEVAGELFATQGYGNTSTNQIVARLNMSVGALYRYFPNKRAILEELNRRYLGQMREVLARIHQVTPSLSLSDYVEELFKHLIAFCSDNPAVIEVFFEAEESAEVTGVDDATFRAEVGTTLSDFFRSRRANLSEARADLMASAFYDVGYLILQTSVSKGEARKGEVDELKKMLILYLERELAH